MADHPPSAPPHPFQDLLGFDVELTDGVVTVWLDVDERHHNPNGVVHGAVVAALMDTAMGGATMSAIEAGNLCATIEMHTRYLSSARTGRLEATASVIRAGRRVVHLSATTVDADGKLIASATSSFAVLPAPG